MAFARPRHRASIAWRSCRLARALHTRSQNTESRLSRSRSWIRNNARNRKCETSKKAFHFVRFWRSGGASKIQSSVRRPAESRIARSPPPHSQPPSIELGNCPIDPDPKAKIQNPLGAEAKEFHGHNKIATQSLQRFRSARPCILCCPPTATPPISHPCKSQVWCSGIFHYRGKIRLSGEAKSNWIIELSIIEPPLPNRQYFGAGATIVSQTYGFTTQCREPNAVAIGRARDHAGRAPRDTREARRSRPPTGRE